MTYSVARMSLLKVVSAWVIAAAGLAACGGAANRNSAPDQPSTPARGTLLQSAPELLSTVTATSLLVQLNVAANRALLALSGPPLCDVLMYDIKYETVGGADEPTTASGALMVPTGLGAGCTGKRPIVLYAHGTTTTRDFTMTNSANAETLILEAVFATQGYIVVAPNYAGYDSSALSYHPYLVADQQSKDMIDALAAARTALPIASLTLTQDNGRLFVTGYSQGGYVAMATHRAMQTAGMPVTASAPMSGPYALEAFVDAVFYGEVNGGATVSSTLLLTAYQHAYGDIYASPTDVFAPQYAPGIDSLLPSTTPRSQLYAQGKLPEFALFSSTPPAPAFADITPPATPANLAEVFALGFGDGNLLQNTYRLSYLRDAQANPDGGFPTITTGLAAAAPALPWRQALRKNDLRNWTPTAPILLCGGSNDPLVFWLNTRLMQGYWTSQSPAPPSFTVLDLESAAAANDPYANLKQDFKLAKDLVVANAIAQGATDGGALALAEAYHATLVAPFCFAATRSFFATQ
ncbi:MAG: prolyl oligopeptidase family serine peptidase [Pseudomonadota bacterium]|nr:prolyl oligopeptidase family serine peptidase [Pseudomonadota bacterium]